MIRIVKENRIIPLIGTPLTNHDILGGGTPSTSQLNCTDSPSAVFTLSGGWPSLQDGDAGKHINDAQTMNKHILTG